MLWTIAIIFALVWALGLVTATMLGGAIHTLIVVAVLLMLIGAFQAGKKSERRRTPTSVRPASADEPAQVVE